MNVLTKRAFFALWFLMPGLVFSQTYVTATYTTGDISTDYDFQGLPGTSSCPGILTVTIPAGNEVTGVDVEYSMTAIGAGYIADQVSWLNCVTTGLGEASAATGSDWSAATQAYSRTDLTIADGATGAVTFELHGGRTYGGSGCNATYNKVDNGTWILTVYYDAIPSCPAPNMLTLAGIATDSADLGWTSSATLFQVEYGVSPLTLGNGIRSLTTGNPYTLSGLLPNTSYDVYVRAICGAGDTSAWSVVKTFTTSCDAFSVPYSENFDAVATPDIPGCMTVENGNSDSYAWTTNTTYPNSVPNSMMITYNSSQAMDDWFFTPGLVFSGGSEYQVKFSYRTSSSYEERLEVMWGDVNSATGMTGGQLWADSAIMSDVYLTDSITFMPSASGIYYVGFHGFSDADMWFLCVDDIFVTEVLPDLSDSAEILAFDIPSQISSVINSLASTVDVVMPQGMDLSSLIPSISVSAGATIDPLSGVANDFTSAVTYTVTAEDGTTEKVWAVNVTVQTNVVENQRDILIYPNPADNIINLDMGDCKTGEYTIRLMNVQGQEIMNRMFFYNGSMTSVYIGDVAKGTYLMYILGPDELREILCVEK